MKFYISTKHGTEALPPELNTKMGAAVIKMTDAICTSLTLEMRSPDDRPTPPKGSSIDWSYYFKGVDKLKNGKTWFERSRNWNPLFWVLCGNHHFLITNTRPTDKISASKYLPVFASYVPKEYKDFIEEIQKYFVSESVEEFVAKPNNNQETNPMKNLFAEMLNANKDAVKLAGKLSVGKAANEVINRRLTKSLPWYAKLFGQHKEVVNNPLTKIATAQLVTAAAMHFAPSNEKIRYVADAMLQEAMVDVATNSEMLQGLISELEGLAGTLNFESSGKTE